MGIVVIVGGSSSLLASLIAAPPVQNHPALIPVLLFCIIFAVLAVRPHRQKRGIRCGPGPQLIGDPNLPRRAGRDLLASDETIGQPAMNTGRIHAENRVGRRAPEHFGKVREVESEAKCAVESIATNIIPKARPERRVSSLHRGSGSATKQTLSLG